MTPGSSKGHLIQGPFLDYRQYGESRGHLFISSVCFVSAAAALQFASLTKLTSRAWAARAWWFSHIDVGCGGIRTIAASPSSSSHGSTCSITATNSSEADSEQKYFNFNIGEWRDSSLNIQLHFERGYYLAGPLGKFKGLKTCDTLQISIGISMETATERLRQVLWSRTGKGI